MVGVTSKGTTRYNEIQQDRTTYNKIQTTSLLGHNPASFLVISYTFKKSSGHLPFYFCTKCRSLNYYGGANNQNIHNYCHLYIRHHYLPINKNSYV